jgi:phosphotransferase system  glucose/maltose/N-acetylglucosamine-specific IIC component
MPLLFGIVIEFTGITVNFRRINNMKYIFAIILSISFSFAQGSNGSSSGAVMNITMNDNSIILNYLKTDLDYDGNDEVLKGERIVRLNENEIWVKNTELISESGDKYYFGNKLKKNNINIMNQVVSEHGYILVYEENEVVTYIAGKDGNKDSDAISISIK